MQGSIQFGRWARLIVLWTGVVLGVVPTAVRCEAVSSEIIQALVSELGDEKFAVREKAKKRLLEIGRPAIPLLRKVDKSDSPEQRLSAAKLVATIQSGVIIREFAVMGKAGDAELDVEHAMWVIALLLDPDLKKTTMTDTLDRMAAKVRERAGKEGELKTLPPAQVVRALTTAMKDEFGLKGDSVTYYRPENSSIHRVLVRKKGLPILLSEIAVAVARRLDLPIVGIPVPGRYMIKYDGAQAPGGKQADIIINPFENWKVTSVAELAQSIRLFNPRDDLAASPPRATIERMLRNMQNHAQMTRQSDLEATIGECLTLINPSEFGVPLR